MHDDPARRGPDVSERWVLEVTLTVLLRQADRLPWESATRRVLTEATFPIREALDRLDEARPIDAERARQLADAAIRAGVASWSDDDGFRAGPVLRARMAQLGVSVLPQLRDDDAEALHAWMSSQAA